MHRLPPSPSRDTMMSIIRRLSPNATDPDTDEYLRAQIELVADYTAVDENLMDPDEYRELLAAALHHAPAGGTEDSNFDSHAYDTILNLAAWLACDDLDTADTNPDYTRGQVHLLAEMFGDGSAGAQAAMREELVSRVAARNR